MGNQPFRSEPGGKGHLGVAVKPGGFIPKYRFRSQVTGGLDLGAYPNSSTQPVGTPPFAQRHKYHISGKKAASAGNVKPTIFRKDSEYHSGEARNLW